MKKEKFRIYGEGFVFVAVCSSLPREAVGRKMAELGRPMRWGYKSNIPTCPANPTTHKHYLFSP